MTEFRFMSGAWENSREPTIVHSDPAGGDPHILCVISRIHNPDALYELCGKANAHDAMRDALIAIAHHPAGGVGCNPESLIEIARSALEGEAA